MAIVAYKIDISKVKDSVVRYDALAEYQIVDSSGITGIRVAATNVADRSVTVTFAPFALQLSPGELAASIYHETIHAEQIANGRSYVDADGNCVDTNCLGRSLNEVEAYDRTIQNKDKFGLTSAEIDDMRTSRDQFGAFLPRNHIKNHGYALPDVAPSMPR